jgi:hypothetical protein
VGAGLGGLDGAVDQQAVFFVFNLLDAVGDAGTSVGRVGEYGGEHIGFKGSGCTLTHGYTGVERGSLDQNALMQIGDASTLGDVVGGEAGDLLDLVVDGRFGLDVLVDEDGRAGKQIRADGTVALRDAELERLGVRDDLERMGAPALGGEERIERTDGEPRVEANQQHCGGHDQPVSSTRSHCSLQCMRGGWGAGGCAGQAANLRVLREPCP